MNSPRLRFAKPAIPLCFTKRLRRIFSPSFASKLTTEGRNRNEVELGDPNPFGGDEYRHGKGISQITITHS